MGITLSTLWVHIHVTLVEMCFLIHVRNEPSRSLRWTDAHLSVGDQHSSHAKCVTRSGRGGGCRPLRVRGAAPQAQVAIRSQPHKLSALLAPAARRPDQVVPCT